jgi:hypothetical protein
MRVLMPVHWGWLVVAFLLDGATCSGVDPVSISTVPTGSSLVEAQFSTDSTLLRLQLAASYKQSAHRFLHLGDNTKAIACFTAARAWLRGCEATSPVYDQCVVGAAEVLASLGGLVINMDTPAACCAGREVFAWVRDRPDLWGMARETLASMSIWRACPALHSLTPAGVEHFSTLACTPLALARNAETIISSFDYTQGELFGDRTDVPYASAAHDLELVPRFRFTSELWDYGRGGHELKQHIDEPTRAYIDHRNISLGFTEMFHSCLPLQTPSHPLFALVPKTKHFLCVWRRHVELFSMVSAIFMSTLDIDKHGSGRAGLPRSRPKLHVLGEDPRLFEFRGRHYFSMQRVTEEVGHRYSETSVEQVFRNFLVDAETGRTVLLKKPDLGAPYACSFAPDGKNWTPFIYEGELYFIYMILPLAILKCDMITGDCDWVPTPRSEGKVEEVGALRGGSFAKVFNGRSLVGFGHATLSSAQHSPFLFVIDMVTYQMELSFMDPGTRSTPFYGFTYMDPTSFWQEDEGDGTVKTYVMCTLRAAPDYLSFDQAHHQTVIFEARSSLLGRVSSDVSYGAGC